MKDKLLFESIINEFPVEVSEIINNLFNKSARLSSENVLKICKAANFDDGSLMMKLLPVAELYAKVPVSKYKVGAVALGQSGNIYLGSNMEFTGEALSCTVHAEQSAIINAWLNGEKGIVKLAVTAAPCGYCRQFINELTTAHEIQILLKDKNAEQHKTFLLNNLLPEAFGPEDLEVEGGLMKEENHNLKVDIKDDELIAAALAAANKSYAPYTKNYSGVALKLDDGSIFSGRYAENAAYNPSMSPLQSALAFMNMNNKLDSAYKIIDAVLVEAESVISQKDSAEAVLSSVSDVKLRYYRVCQFTGT